VSARVQSVLEYQLDSGLSRISSTRTTELHNLQTRLSHNSGEERNISVQGLEVSSISHD